jgi:hypothetical protein
MVQSSKSANRAKGRPSQCPKCLTSGTLVKIGFGDEMFYCKNKIGGCGFTFNNNRYDEIVDRCEAERNAPEKDKKQKPIKRRIGSKKKKAVDDDGDLDLS